MKEYEVIFEISGRCRVTIYAKDEESLWDKIDLIKDEVEIEDIESVDVRDITEY